MDAFHEECLRLSAKALQSQLTAQDLNEASLWFGMVGQHFQETNFDSVIDAFASKGLNQLQTTSMQLDYAPLISVLSNELSVRVGWDVTGRLRSLFSFSFDDQVHGLQYVKEYGLSSMMIASASKLAEIAPARPASLTYKCHPQLLKRSAFNGYQSAPKYPPPAPRPPLISFDPCKLLNGVSIGLSGSAVLAAASDVCAATGEEPASICWPIVGLSGGTTLAQLIAYEMNCGG